jgi:hypothetical protein
VDALDPGAGIDRIAANRPIASAAPAATIATSAILA